MDTSSARMTERAERWNRYKSEFVDNGTTTFTLKGFDVTLKDISTSKKPNTVNISIACKEENTGTHAEEEMMSRLVASRLAMTDTLKKMGEYQISGEPNNPATLTVSANVNSLDKKDRAAFFDDIREAHRAAEEIRLRAS